ncbi:MAG TPA: hypothetical protein VMI54_10945 [Polyangiaceae bacterium]|nr:hypothetical protein [Polyangiaceae bacterium]
MLISPAKLSGQRGQALLGGASASPLAKRLASREGAPLGDVFSFVSGLYFRGKASYARAFARAENGSPAAFVMTAGGGLLPLDERIHLERLRGWAAVSIHEDNPSFTAPLYRHASGLVDAHGAAARFVLLGSIATQKYVAPLLDVFAERLFFPSEFRGRGDMSRGSLLLRAVREARELDYARVTAALGEGAA